jgi:hypothetical protein
MTDQDRSLQADVPLAAPEPSGRVERGSEADKGAKAVEGAGEVAQTAQRAAGEVASTAAGEARALVEDARSQAQELMSKARGELSEQAEQRAQHAAQGLRTLSDQLRAMAEGHPEEAGPVASWTREMQLRLQQWSGRLEQGGVEGVLRDLSRFARRRPGVFLVGCVAAGVVVGRVVKDVAGADRPVPSTPPSNGYESAPAAPSRTAGVLPPRDEVNPLGEPAGVGVRTTP